MNTVLYLSLETITTECILGTKRVDKTLSLEQLISLYSDEICVRKIILLLWSNDVIRKPNVIMLYICVVKGRWMLHVLFNK